MKITDTLREQVREILQEYQAARESDNVLFYFWLERYFTHPQALSAHEMLRAMEKHEIPKMEALTRTRRWVQENHPDLRPADYEERKLHQDDVVQDLGYTVPAWQQKEAV